MGNNKKWEYHVIHVNVDKDVVNPNLASDKFKGVLSSDFIKKEFPKKYDDKNKQSHPAKQLCNFFNKFGNEGWELIETFELNNKLMIVFKREKILENISKDETKVTRN
mgnify:FL=1